MPRSTFRATLWLAFALALLQAFLPMRSQAHVPDAAAVMLQEICTVGGVAVGSAAKNDNDRESRSAAASCEACPLCATATPLPILHQSLRVVVLGAPGIFHVPRSTRVIASFALLHPSITGPPRSV